MKVKIILISLLTSVTLVNLSLAQEALCTYTKDLSFKIKTDTIKNICVDGKPALFYINDKQINTEEYSKIMSTAISDGDVDLGSAGSFSASAKWNNDGTVTATTTFKSPEIKNSISSNNFSSSDSCLNLQYNLKLKSNDKNTNGEVTKLQDFLAKNAYLVGVTINGNYGPATRKAVKDFQRSNNLVVTGIVGKITRGKVSALSCGDKTNSARNIINIIKEEDVNNYYYKKPEISKKQTDISPIFTKEQLSYLKKDYIDLCLFAKENKETTDSDFKAKMENIINKNLMLNIKLDNFSDSGIFFNPQISETVDAVNFNTCVDGNPIIEISEVTYSEELDDTLTIKGENLDKIEKINFYGDPSSISGTQEKKEVLLGYLPTEKLKKYTALGVASVSKNIISIKKISPFIILGTEPKKVIDSINKIEGTINIKAKIVPVPSNTKSSEISFIMNLKNLSKKASDIIASQIFN